MEQDTDLNSNVYCQNPIASSSGNNFSSIAQHDHSEPFSSSHGTKRRQPQSTEPGLEPDPKRSNEANTSCSTDSEELLRRLEQAILLIKVLQDNNEKKDMNLKQKQTECEQKDNHLKVYSTLIKRLEEDCNVKSKQLAEKDIIIDRLKLEAIANDKRLATFNNQSNSNAINELQEKCNRKDAELVEMKSKIKQLEKEAAQKDTQLQSNSAKIDELQTKSDNKDTQLADMESKIKQLEEEVAKQNSQLQSKTAEICELQMNSEKLKNLEKNMGNINSYFKTLFDRAEKHKDQKQYDKAITHYENVIEFEQATQNRPNKLVMLFVNKTFCHGALKSYQQAIDAASSALQCDPNCKEALYNRAFAYFESKNYLSACHDLEKILELDSEYEKARNLLEQVQKCSNKGTSLIAFH